MRATLRSGELAKAAGVNPQTLRYYERRGLLATPSRAAGGHRLYPVSAVTLLRVIKTAQRLGFTLDEVTELVGLDRLRYGRRADGRRSDRRRADSPWADGLQARAAAKLSEIEARIADLQTTAATLRAAVDAGCDDLVQCAASSCRPLPFADAPVRS
jgi:DNA-binding transcriptional MerR regulator